MSSAKNPTLLIEVNNKIPDLFATVKKRIEECRLKCKCEPDKREPDALPTHKLERFPRRELAEFKWREIAAHGGDDDAGSYFFIENFRFQNFTTFGKLCGSFPDDYPDTTGDGSGPEYLDKFFENSVLYAQNCLEKEPNPKNITPCYYASLEGYGRYLDTAFPLDGADLSDPVRVINGQEPLSVDFCGVSVGPQQDVSGVIAKTAKCATSRAEHNLNDSVVYPYAMDQDGPKVISFYTDIGTDQLAATEQHVVWHNFATFKDQADQSSTNVGSWGLIERRVRRLANSRDELLLCDKGRDANALTSANSVTMSPKSTPVELQLSDVSSYRVETPKARFYVSCFAPTGAGSLNGANLFNVGDKVRLGSHPFVRAGQYRETSIPVGTIAEVKTGTQSYRVCRAEEELCNGVCPVAYIRGDITGQQPYNPSGIFPEEVTEQPMCDNYNDYQAGEEPDCGETRGYEGWEERLKQFKENKRRDPEGNIYRWTGIAEGKDQAEIDAAGLFPMAQAAEEKPIDFERDRLNLRQSTRFYGASDWTLKKRGAWSDRQLWKAAIGENPYELRKGGSRNLRGVRNGLPGFNIFPRPWNSSCDPNIFTVYGEREEITYAIDFEDGNPQQLGQKDDPFKPSNGMSFAAQWDGDMFQVFEAAEEGDNTVDSVLLKFNGCNFLNAFTSEYNASLFGWVTKDTEGKSHPGVSEVFEDLTHWQTDENGTIFMGGVAGKAYFKQRIISYRRPTDDKHYRAYEPYISGYYGNALDPDFKTTSGYKDGVVPKNLDFNNTSSGKPYLHTTVNFHYPNLGTTSVSLPEGYGTATSDFDDTYWDYGNNVDYGNGTGSQLESYNPGPFMEVETVFNGNNAAWDNCGAPEAVQTVRFFEWDCINGRISNETDWIEVEYTGDCSDSPTDGPSDVKIPGMQNTVSERNYDWTLIEADSLPNWWPFKAARQAGFHETWMTNQTNSTAFRYVPGIKDPQDLTQWQSPPGAYAWRVNPALLKEEKWEEWFKAVNPNQLPEDAVLREFDMAPEVLQSDLDYSASNPMPLPEKWHEYERVRFWIPPVFGTN